MSSPIFVAALVLLAVIALGAVVMPLLRRGATPASAARFDRAVYRDQLHEVDLDLARGVLDADEAASARLEIERRLLSTDDAEQDATARYRRHRLLAAAIVLVVAVWATGFYLTLGMPGVPDMPLATRARAVDETTGHRDVEEIAARLEARLKANGGDERGWMLLARTETGLRHWDKSAEAYRHVLDLAPDADPAIQVAYAETLVLAAQGIVTPTASDAFHAALARDPGNRIARFYLTLADAQAGNIKQAIDAWIKLAGELPANSDMRTEIQRRVAEAAQAAGITTPPLPPPASATEGQ